MTLQTVLEAAKGGDHAACQSCPWRPRSDRRLAFGESCQDHGIKWQSGASTVSMQIGQDPANTTPATTGKLCFVCNSENRTDKTAQHAFDLWKAAVALGSAGESARCYLDKHYLTNSMMHGGPVGERPAARTCCTKVLYDQIRSLSPKVIIACGESAATSLKDVGLLKKPWGEYRRDFKQGVYSECSTLVDQPVTVFCTYHTSGSSVNRRVQELYDPSTEAVLTTKLKDLEDDRAAKEFLGRYNPQERPGMKEGRGMRVLLLHWLEIGKAIREANAITP